MIHSLIPMLMPLADPSGDLISWAPGPELIATGRKIAGIVVMIWVVYIAFTALLPGKGGRNGLARMGMGKIALTVFAILLAADLSMVPKIANFAYTIIKSGGSDLLGILGVK